MSTAATRDRTTFPQANQVAAEVAAPLPARRAATPDQLTEGISAMRTPALVAIAAGLLLLAGGGYAVSCWWWPFAACRWCSGTARSSRADRKVWRPCRWCRGTGRRMRFGRQLYNVLTRAGREASR